MKQSCYFAKVCDREFNKKHIGVNLFLLNVVYINIGCHFCLKKAQNLFQDFGY